MAPVTVTGQGLARPTRVAVTTEPTETGNTQRLERYFNAGKRFGDFFNDRYFALDENGRRKWDRHRIIHHGALGYAIASGSLLAMAATKSPTAHGVLSRTLAVGLGLAESDVHDMDRWWSEGKLLSAGSVLFSPLRRSRRED